MPKYKIEYIKDGVYSALIVALTYENIFTCLKEIEKELVSNNIRGYVIFDNLLKSGNNNERFIVAFFDGHEFGRNSFEFIKFDRTDSIRKLSNSLLIKYKNIVEMSILSKFEKDLLFSGVSI